MDSCIDEGPTFWQLEIPITRRLGRYCKKKQRKDSSPGLDKVTVEHLIGIPSIQLAQRFSAWLAAPYVPQRCVMATSDHNMTSSENSETSSESTLKKQTVRVADLIQANKDMEKVNGKKKNK